MITISHRVNYPETDQMGVVYHARYLEWLDRARTEYLRAHGMAYREVEARGFFLVVADLSIRYRQPALYDDVVRITCWVEDCGSRRVTFGYAVEREDPNDRLATATTALVSLDRARRVVRIPDDIASRLHPESPPPR